MDDSANTSTTFSTASTVADPAGLHLRPAAAIAQVANQFDADVTIECDGKQASGKSLLSLCMLAARAGARLSVFAVGRDAYDAIRALDGVFLRMFGKKTAPQSTPVSRKSAPRKHAPREQTAPTPPVSTADPAASASDSSVPGTTPHKPSKQDREPKGVKRAPPASPHLFTWAVQETETHVSLAGDFTHWRPVPMTRHGDHFKASIHLTPGEHQYKFIVDGEWVVDPTTHRSAPNGFGSANSVVHIAQRNEP